jgi:hypothetical protein
VNCLARRSKILKCWPQVRPLGHLGSGPVILRTCGLQWLACCAYRGALRRGLDEPVRKRLLRMNEALVAAAIRGASVRRLAVDVDNSVISTGF